MELKSKKVILSSPEAVFAAIQELWNSFPEYDKARENLFGMYLDVKNKLLCVELHAQGTIDNCIIYPREVIRKALFCNAGGVILFHNHPSGDVGPSSQDKIMTDKLKVACTMMDIHVLDNLVIADKDYYSFKDHGLLQGGK